MGTVVKIGETKIGTAAMIRQKAMAGKSHFSSFDNKNI